MTASELTSELDRLREMARHEDSHSGAMIFESKARILVENEFDLILKSLRFAADIEKVLICHPRIERCDTGVEISVYDDGVGHRVRFVAKDIYSAARKAVEALGGK